MASRELRIGAAAAAAVVLLLVLLAVATLQVRRHVEARLLEALGPRAQVGAMVWGWHALKLDNLRIAAAGAESGGATRPTATRALGPTSTSAPTPAQSLMPTPTPTSTPTPMAWPAADELRAGRVVLRFDWGGAWAGLTGGAWRFSSVDVEGGFLSVLRTPQGRLRLLPALLERPRPQAVEGGAAPARVAWRVDELRVDGATLDLYDASLGDGRAHRFTLQRVHGRVAPWGWPALDTPVAVDLGGDIQGTRRQGRIAVRGSVAPTTQDARLSIRVENADLAALAPYWARLRETGVHDGRLDLTLDANVSAGVLRAPGTLTLAELELQTRSGLVGAIAGMAREAELAALSRDGRVAVRFTLEGPLAHPAIVVDQAPKAHLATGLAEALGIGVGGLVRGLGGLVNGLLGN